MAIIIPALHERALPAQLDKLCARQAADEIIVVQANDPETAARLRAWAANHSQPAVRIMRTVRGRAWQMNYGAARARSDVLLFLHADTELPDDGIEWIRVLVESGALWGRFDVRLSGRRAALRVIERMMNWRAAATGIATGDQALFVRRDLFHLLGGFAPIELMEDIELSARLKWFGRPARIRAPVVTSSRRWETRGIARTVVRMWALRLLYALGVAPARLAKWYK